MREFATSLRQSVVGRRKVSLVIQPVPFLNFNSLSRFHFNRYFISIDELKEEEILVGSVFLNLIRDI